jgi:hypothetical protein
MALIFILLVVNSWSWQLAENSASNGAAFGQNQRGVLAAMQWMNATTPRGSQVVSVTDSDFNFYQLIYGRASGYAPLAPPDEIVASAVGSTEPTYVVLTKIGTVIATNATQNPFNLYPNDTRFQLQYNQSGVLVYKLKG